MKAYRVKSKILSGSDYEEVYPQAAAIYKRIRARNPRRQPHIRSAYFSNSKVFIHSLWLHLDQKNNRDRIRRMKYLACGIELIRHSRFEPSTKINPNNSNAKLYRFAGITSDDELFYVQIREDRRTGRKY